MPCTRRYLTVNCSLAVMGLLTFHGCLAESRGVPGPAPGPLETSSQSTHPVPAPAPSPADVPTPAIAASILPATPAPSLTPKSSPPSPPAPTAPAPTPPVHPQGDSCSGGCIAGAVIGSLAGVAILAALAFFAWGTWGAKGHEGGTYLPSLPPAKYAEGNYEHPDKPVTHQPIHTVATSKPGSVTGVTGASNALAPAGPAGDNAAAALWPGQVVCCRTGRNSCQNGNVISSATGKTLQVKIGGEAKTLQVQDVVHLFQRNEKVHYTDPVDGQHRVATVVEAQGDHWPPSYQIKFANESGLIDTVQKQLKPFRGSQV